MSDVPSERPAVAIEVLGVRVEAESGAPVMLLREVDDPHRVLPIFIGGPEAVAIAMGLQGLHTERPLTHDLFADVLARTDVVVDAATVTALQGSTFLAELALRSPTGDRTVSCRPSDAVALAVRVGAPLYVSAQVMDVAAAVPEPEAADEAQTDPEAIEAEVEEFRSFLSEVDPEDFTN